MKAVARRIRTLTVERENLMISGLDQGIRWVKKINSKRILNALRKMINHRAAQVVYQVVSRVRMATLTILEIKSNLWEIRSRKGRWRKGIWWTRRTNRRRLYLINSTHWVVVKFSSLEAWPVASSSHHFPIRTTNKKRTSKTTKATICLQKSQKMIISSKVSKK